jgi:thiosulfate reductase cytochrome b subunit
MNDGRMRTALLVLQWVLGLVILVESAVFVFSPGAAHAFARTGLPNFVRHGVGGMEMAAAVLFLIPRATVAGGWLLVAVLSLAIVVHLLHGWFDVGGLVVYLVATWAAIRYKTSPLTAK